MTGLGLPRHAGGEPGTVFREDEWWISMLPVIGRTAPDFTLPSTTGENISLKQYKGRRP